MRRKLIFGSFMALVSLIVIPRVQAYYPVITIHDEKWDIYTSNSGIDIVKPDTTVEYRIYGWLNASGGVRDKLVASISVYTTTAWEWTTIHSDYILPEEDYTDYVSLDKFLNVTIPDDTFQNSPVCLRLQTLTRDWSDLIVSIVQDPSYSDVVSERDYWENEYDTMKDNRDLWKSDYDDKTTEYNLLQDDYDTLESQHSILEIKHNDLTTDFAKVRNLSYIFIITTIVFIATTVYFKLRKPEVKPS